MTPIFFLCFYAIGILLTLFKHPIWGLYTYLFTFYLAPTKSWWRDEVPDFRYLFVIGLIALAASFRLPKDGRPPWYKTGIGKLLILYVAYMWLQLGWAVDVDWQQEGAILFTKHLIVFYLMYKLSDSIERVTIISIAHVVGCAWFGWLALGVGGGRLETIGGPVAGSNSLGAHVVTALLFGGILLISLTGKKRAALFACLPLVANCLVLTVSRGAFLGLIGGGIAGYICIPARMKRVYKFAGLLAIVLFAMLAHETLVERFSETFAALTSETEELDGSAASRMTVALAGVEIGLDHPFGAGYKGTAVLSPSYMDERLLTGTGQRSAHNSAAAIFAEQGFPGIILFLLMLVWVFRTMRAMRRTPDADENFQYKMCMSYLIAALVSIYIAGNFTNNSDHETQFWCLGLLASVFELQKQAFARSRVQTDLVEAPKPSLSGVKTAASL